MAVKESIILGIIQHIEASSPPNNGSWCIGLTCDLPPSFEAWGHPAGLFFWEADTLDGAKAIEPFCVQTKGMRPRPTAGSIPTSRSASASIPGPDALA